MADAGYQNLHSRLVRFLKIAMPLLALAILATLFLFSPRTKPEDAIPYVEGEGSDGITTPRITDAGFAGMTADGAALTLHADEARAAETGKTDGASAQGLTGLLETPDGATLRVTAEAGKLDKAKREIRLDGRVLLDSSTGITVSVEGLVIALDQTNVESIGQVRATGPFGQLTADHLKLSQEKGAEGGYVLLFKGNVSVIYKPDQ